MSPVVLQAGQRALAGTSDRQPNTFPGPRVLTKCRVSESGARRVSGNKSGGKRLGIRRLITVLPKPLFCVVLPDSAVFIAFFPNFGAVLTIEAKLVGGPADNCYSK
jgi:hypothetical protein